MSFRSLSFLGLLAAAVCVTAALAATRACEASQIAGFLQGVPAKIETTEAIVYQNVPDLREGCGAAAFGLSQRTVDQIAAEGIAYFESSNTGRDGGKYFRYQPWQPTPATKAPVLRGLSCAHFNESLSKALRDAAALPGSFYSVGYEYDVLVIPRLRMVVVSYAG